jgi:uncharacterized protein (TIGR00369 family)
MEPIVESPDTADLRREIDLVPRPRCAALIPFALLEADRAGGLVRVRFEPQPAFENHFRAVQGGFGVAMLDVCISLAALAKTGQWCPTVELKCSFLSPLPVASAMGEGRVFRAGRSLAFVEGRLFAEDGTLAMHATATVSVPS